jgi:glyoxylase-like metal-dependent hydrolase (beta-lactamase superfamily II)
MQKNGYKNVFRQDTVEPRIWKIVTEPSFAIGQSAIFIQTDSGNVLWDCITLLDQETIDWINEKGGLKAIVISHPHFYTTHLDWAKAFGCNVFLAKPDEQWLNRADKDGDRILLTETSTEIWPDGPRALIVGGHFPGSMILLWNKSIFVADTIMAVPVCPSLAHSYFPYPADSFYSALNANGRTPGTTSYVFMYSYPNMLPLPPNTLLSMWNVLKTIDFDSSYAPFPSRDVRDTNLKARVLESMQIQARNAGHTEHEIFLTKL